MGITLLAQAGSAFVEPPPVNVLLGKLEFRAPGRLELSLKFEGLNGVVPVFVVVEATLERVAMNTSVGEVVLAFRIARPHLYWPNPVLT